MQYFSPSYLAHPLTQNIHSCDAYSTLFYSSIVWMWINMQQNEIAAFVIKVNSIVCLKLCIFLCILMVFNDFYDKTKVQEFKIRKQTISVKNINTSIKVWNPIIWMNHPHFIVKSISCFNSSQKERIFERSLMNISH